MDSMSFTAESTDDFPEFARGLKVLLVNHDRDSLLFTLTVLEVYSYDVVSTEEASKALSLISEQHIPYKLVMANIDMSDSHSVCFLHALLEKDVPVVLMSADMNDDLMKKARDKGARFMPQESVTIEDLKNVWQEVYLQNDSCLKQWDDMINSHDNVFDIFEIPEVSEHPFGGTKTTEDAESCKSVTGNSRMGDNVYRNYLKNFPRRGANEYILAKSNEKTTSRKKRSVDHKVKHAKMKRVKSTRQEKAIKKNITVKTNTERMVWTDELRFQFSAAVSALGDAKARPKAIVEMMGEDKVTTRQVASFLQKYKILVRKIHQQTGIDSEKTMPSNSSNGNQQTSSVGGEGEAAEPTASATPSFSIGSLFSANSSNNYDTVRQQQHPNLSQGGLFGNGDHGISLTNGSLLNAGVYQKMNQLKERSALAYRNHLNIYRKIRDLRASELSSFKASNGLPSMRYMTSKADYPNMSSNTFQLPHQPPVMHQQQLYSPALTNPFGYRRSDNSTEVFNQQKMNLPSMNYSAPKANGHYAPASLPSMNCMRPNNTSVNQEAVYSPANFYSYGTNSTNNSYPTEAPITNEQDFQLNLPCNQYTITDVDVSLRRSGNVFHLPKEPLGGDLDQFWTPELCADFDALFENMVSEVTDGLEFPEGGTPSFAANNLSNPPALNFNSPAAGEAPLILPSNVQQPLSASAQEPVEYNAFGNVSDEGYTDDDLKWLEDIIIDGTGEAPLILPSNVQQPLSEHAQEPVGYNAFGNASDEGFTDDDLKWLEDIIVDGTEEH